MRIILTSCALVLFSSFATSVTTQTRLLEIDDLFELRTVGTPRISPDGDWVAYTVSQLDIDADRSDTDIFMSSLSDPAEDGIRLTTSDRSETAPRWSPDGRYLGFLSSRDDEGTEVWILDRRGGEATRLTNYKGNVSAFSWSPDATKFRIETFH